MNTNKVIKNVILLLDKVLSLVADRRVWWTLLFVGGTIFKVNEWVEGADALSQQAVEVIQLCVTAVAAVIGYVSLLISHTKRPPTGLMYKVDPAQVIEATIQKYING